MSQTIADIYNESVYLGGLQSAFVWVERRREPHIVRHERYLDLVTKLPELKKALAVFSNTVEEKDTWRV